EPARHAGDRDTGRLRRGARAGPRRVRGGLRGDALPDERRAGLGRRAPGNRAVRRAGAATRADARARLGFRGRAAVMDATAAQPVLRPNELADTRFPPRELVVVPDLLARRAEETPEKPFAVFPDERWTYRRT